MTHTQHDPIERIRRRRQLREDLHREDQAAFDRTLWALVRVAVALALGLVLILSTI